jgi:dTDP-4-dehydrorhamnose 3,5-epimerase
MHFQAEPHPESKLVRCTRGAIFDIVIDIRPSSAAFRRWIGFELSAENRSALFIPPGCAHGFLTLEDSTEVFYQMSEFYHPDLARGVRWNDPSFGIELPFEPMVIADRDRSYPDFTPLPER